MSSILITIIILLLLVTPAYAAQDSLSRARIAPDSPLYFLKGVREVLEVKFAGTTHILALREIEFATRRIREIKSLAVSLHQDLIQPTLEKYAAHLNKLEGIASLQDENMAGQVSGAVILHMDQLQNIYPQISNPEARRFVRTTIYRLSEWQKSLISRLNLAKQPTLAEQVLISKLSGCRFLEKEASSSALNEIEKAVYAERAQKCLVY